MRNVLILSVVLAVALVAVSSVNAADTSGQVPQATLQAMGLGGMQVVSDEAGMDVRGKGFYLVQSSIVGSWKAGAASGLAFYSDGCCPTNLYATTTASLWGVSTGNYIRTR
jgi:hypothetical protein